MNYAQRKLEWCLKKAEKELTEKGTHRGLITTKPDKEKAREHIKKAEYYLKATDHLKTGGYSDISASTIFYSIYHCFLAIATKFGYESRNQECTFALIHTLIAERKIAIEKETINKIASLEIDETTTKTTTSIREQYQYGTNLSISEDLYTELFDLAKEILSKTKTIIES
ncbi:MAG TPA: hypothetical protein VJG90_01560 [Candidatus Nanoarchaeia archaeon]|nr:hypothetical protein [Candidatus Nanoarchaeia archaeon]